jgi:hypothetical protein
MTSVYSLSCEGSKRNNLLSKKCDRLSRWIPYLTKLKKNYGHFIPVLGFGTYAIEEVSTEMLGFRVLK